MGDLAGIALGHLWGQPVIEGQSTGLVEDCYTTLIRYAEGELRPGTVETPGRAAQAWRDLTSGYKIDDEKLLKCFDSEGHDEIVLVAHIPFFSLCEHHLLPFHGVGHVAYIPNGRIVGLSKIPRLLDAYARRLQVQERMTTQIADSLEKHLDPKGVMVMIAAEHLCMTMRGAKVAGSRTTTSVVRGIFKEDPRARGEALSMIQ